MRFPSVLPVLFRYLQFNNRKVQSCRWTIFPHFGRSSLH